MESKIFSMMLLVVGSFIVSNKISATVTTEDKIVVLETTQGVIEIKLMSNVAPKTCENFEKLVEKGYYNGIIYHRVI